MKNLVSIMYEKNSNFKLNNFKQNFQSFCSFLSEKKERKRADILNYEMKLIYKII